MKVETNLQDSEIGNFRQFLNQAITLIENSRYQKVVLC